jgi:serine/threonine protein kinase
VGLLDSLKKMFGGGGGAKKKKVPVSNIDKRFELMNKTGQGSMSKVWKAYDRQLGRTVCLKILDREKTITFEKRFLGLDKPSEGEICVLLKHKNIVQTFEYGISTKKEPFLVMELIEGKGLDYMVDTRSTELEQRRLDILIQLADGVEFLHKLGYLHRDLCPRNAMVTNDGVVKLIDFGLAIPFRPQFLKPGNRTGTTAYLAPELIKRQTTDQRVDMFSLGVTAYQLFTGEMPWEKAPSERLLRMMVNVPGRDPRELKPDMDEATAKFLIKAIERDPKQRFQRAAEFRDAVRGLKQE